MLYPSTTPLPSFFGAGASQSSLIDVPLNGDVLRLVGAFGAGGACARAVTWFDQGLRTPLRVASTVYR